MKTYTAKAHGRLYLSSEGFFVDSAGTEICKALAGAAGIDGYFNGAVTVTLTIDNSNELTITEGDDDAV